jgi:hypothetical protein
MVGRVDVLPMAQAAADAWNFYDHPEHAPMGHASDDVVDAVWGYALGAGERHAQLLAVSIWRREAGLALQRLGDDLDGPVARFIRAVDGAALNAKNKSISPTAPPYSWSDRATDLAYTYSRHENFQTFRTSDAQHVARSILAVWPLGHHSGRVSMAGVINHLVPRTAEDHLRVGADTDLDSIILTGAIGDLPLYRWVEQTQDMVRLACEEAPPPEAAAAQSPGRHAFPAPGVADTNAGDDHTHAASPTPRPEPGQSR